MTQQETDKLLSECVPRHLGDRRQNGSGRGLKTHRECLREFEGGHLYEIDGVAVVDLHGDWHRMGRQYGFLARSRMADVLDYLDGKLAGNTAKLAAANDIAQKLFANYPQHLKEFFEGMAETSSISPERLQLCNAVEYAEACFFCSAMAAWGGFSSGRLVFGRNYDAVSYSELAEDIVVAIYHPDGEQAAATVGYAGEIYCVNGMNESGLFIELNNGMPSAGNEIHWELCPATTGLFDQLFKAESLDDLNRFFNGTRSSSSYIIGVADSREARSYEWCFAGTERGDGTTPDGLMVSANHYVNSHWPFALPSDSESWNSLSRHCNLLGRTAENKGTLDIGKVKEIMSTPIEEGGPFHHLTRYQIVAVPEELTLHIRILPGTLWSEIRLGELF